jgi:hypothetical protein
MAITLQITFSIHGVVCNLLLTQNFALFSKDSEMKIASAYLSMA